MAGADLATGVGGGYKQMPVSLESEQCLGFSCYIYLETKLFDLRDGGPWIVL